MTVKSYIIYTYIREFTELRKNMRTKYFLKTNFFNKLSRDRNRIKKNTNFRILVVTLKFKQWNLTLLVLSILIKYFSGVCILSQFKYIK